MRRSIPKAEVEAMTEVLESVRKDWLRRPGVTAVDVGFKYREGKATDVPAIRVHVQRKLPAAAVPPHDLFPERLGRHEVDVIEAGYGPQQDQHGGGRSTGD